MRPVLLTSVTTVLGLMPMVLGLNIDFFNRTIIQGSPSSQWWTELSSAIAGGLVIATVLTLVVTPALLVMTDTGDEAFGELWKRRFGNLIAALDGRNHWPQ